MDTLSPGCKINVFLHLLGRRPDGYHDLFSLFLPLSEPHDIMRIEERQGEGCRLRCAVEGIDLEKNTVTKAWRLFADATGYAPALDVELVKGVPHGAGLGGGSADAAEMLLWLNAHSSRKLERAELDALAARIGADVPFFLEGKPCIVEGIGEKLTPLDADSEWLAPLRGSYGLLLCPAVQVNTAWAYGAWDAAHPDAEVPAAKGFNFKDQDIIPESAAGAEKSAFSASSDPSKALTESAVPDKNLCSVFFPPLRVENGFESVVFARWPELAELKTLLLRQGAFAAGMSGSGASLFGFFRSREDAGRCAACIGESDDGCKVYPFSACF